MSSARYNSTKTLLAVDNKVIRIGLREAFKHSGFRQFTEVAEQGALIEALNASCFDLIIACAELDGMSVPPIISAMRNGQMPHHPFHRLARLVYLCDGCSALLVRGTSGDGSEAIR